MGTGKEKKSPNENRSMEIIQFEEQWEKINK